MSGPDRPGTSWPNAVVAATLFLCVAAVLIALILA